MESPTQFLDHRGPLFHAVPLEHVTEHNVRLGNDALFGYTDWSNLSHNQMVYVEFEHEPAAGKTASKWL